MTIASSELYIRSLSLTHCGGEAILNLWLKCGWLEGGLEGLPLRVSNEGLPRPRVARAQETLSPALLSS